MQFENIVQRVTENLYEDERLRSNMTDNEAKVVLDWATGWIGERVNAAIDEASAKQIAQNELARVKQTVTAFNVLTKKPGTLRLADAFAALGAAVAPASATMTREQVLSLTATLISALWKMQAKKT